MSKFWYLSLPALVVFTQPGCQAQPGKTGSNLDSITVAVNTGIYPNIESVVIAEKDNIVFEKYFHGFTKNKLHDTRSSFKSITGILTGIAIDKGMIKSTAEKVYDFFPEYPRGNNWDAWKAGMTIEHLLEMKSGFDCEEWIGTNDCEDRMWETNDWIKFCLDLPLKNEPGSKWDYTSINTMILGGIIARASHMTVSEFARKYLFEPLGITNYRWTKDPAGQEMTSGSFFILPADMLKIGQLVLNGGSYNGKRIVSAAWIDKITSRITKIEDFSNVQISKNKEAMPQPTWYGCTWYNEEIKTGTFAYNVIFASGNGGQYIMIVKELGLVVVFTGNSYNSSKSKLPFDIMIKYILPHFTKI